MRVAVVTGASKGIGLAISTRLAEEGWSVVLCSRDGEAIARSAAELGRRGLEASWHVCDVGDAESVESMREYLTRQYGGVNLLVNNAGIPGATRPTWTVPLDEWNEVLRVNLTGPFLCSRALLPGMIERSSGHIINIASITGKRPLAQRSTYAASKLGLVGFTRSLAAEVGRHGIRVNAISPGLVEGERIEGVLAGQAVASGRSIEEVRYAMVSETPLGRMVTDVEIANAVIALDGMSGVTGIDLNVTAGLVMF
ncbi:MAG: SDR family NAD(P)-dependent oxidoreductase [Actinomycetota bacterium]|nr:SDR family NAD(P)-dependent oxidoreductase [Actinomycetota bacterium]